MMSHQTSPSRFRAVTVGQKGAIGSGREWCDSSAVNAIARSWIRLVGSWALAFLVSSPVVAAAGDYLPEIGPSASTLHCQQVVYEDYPTNRPGSEDPPLSINPNEPLPDDNGAFDGVRMVTLDPGTVTPGWECGTTNGRVCLDQTNPQPQIPRGTALLWVPDGVASGAPRALYVHGGSWWLGSPWSSGYPTFVAKLARRLRMPILAIDYTLAPYGRYVGPEGMPVPPSGTNAPLGDFEEILHQIGMAVNFLARHEPLDILNGDTSTTTNVSLAPPLFLLGDSSGGGSAVSAMVAQASPDGLPGAGGAILSGAVVYSPWINLESDSPTYVSNLYGVSDGGSYMIGDIAFGQDAPLVSLQNYKNNARDYMGSRFLDDPVANPFRAPDEWLRRIKPIAFHVGQPELLLSDSSIFASRIAANGGSTEFHQYDGMWHVFPMYEEGCRSNEPVVLARSAYEASARFLNGLVEKKKFCCQGVPCFFGHYEYPQGTDTAADASSFDGCQEEPGPRRRIPIVPSRRR